MNASVLDSVPSPADAPIGIFDSGVGGLSVMRHVRALLPREHLIYFADSGYAPYGDKTEAVLVARSLAIADFLLKRGAKALVVACNTATVAAIHAVRAAYPQLPIVGVEPGLKPAAALSRSGKIGVLATASTLGGAKFLQLREQVSKSSEATFLLQACVGLVEQIEKGELDSAATVALLEHYVLPLLAQGADTLVLGCTHYPFVLEAIAAIAARAGTGAGAGAGTGAGAGAGTGAGSQAVTLVDTGEAVARQLARLLDGAGLLRAGSGDAAEARLQAYTSAGADALALAFSGLLGLRPRVDEVSIDHII